MRGLLLVIGLVTALANAKDVPGPSQFYIVSVFFTDDGGVFYQRIADVRQDGTDTLIRYSRIAPVGDWCPRFIVQSTDVRVPNSSPAAQAGTNNPCAVAPRDLSVALKKYHRRWGVFETFSFGIVTQCGSSTSVLRLPIEESVDMPSLKEAHLEMARLWDLMGEITGREFGSKDIFHDRIEDDERLLQRAGERILPELSSGRFDAGLSAAFKGNIGTWRHPTFRSLLQTYRGPVFAAEPKIEPIPQLLDATKYRFSQFVAPAYPPLAKMARIQGKVELRITVDPATGDVLDAVVVSGHPLLTPSAITAARQWRFVPESPASQTIAVMLDFALPPLSSCR